MSSKQNNCSQSGVLMSAAYVVVAQRGGSVRGDDVSTGPSSFLPETITCESSIALSLPSEIGVFIYSSSSRSP